MIIALCSLLKMFQKQFDFLLYELCFCICEVFDFFHLDYVYAVSVEPLFEYYNPQLFAIAYTKLVISFDWILLRVCQSLCLTFDFCRLAVFLYLCSICAGLYGMLGVVYFTASLVDQSLIGLVKIKMPELQMPVFITVSRNKTNYE